MYLHTAQTLNLGCCGKQNQGNTGFGHLIRVLGFILCSKERDPCTTDVAGYITRSGSVDHVARCI